MNPSLIFDFDRYPYLTPQLHGIGGQIRGAAHEFQVTEIPLYTPSGQGEHYYLYIEKEGLTTRQVFDFIRQELRVNEAGIGVAGLKDKQAITRQWISVPARVSERMDGLELMPGVRILEAGLHTNKLGVGHLRGNRFRILVRGVEAGALEQARAILSALSLQGVPNYYGPQRFGLGGKNPERGYELVTTGKGRGNIWLKRFLIGSLQSLLFNDWLGWRLEHRVFDQMMLGDVAKKHQTGGEFVVEDLETDNQRAQAFELSATGVLHGKKIRQAQAEAAQLEDQILARYQLERSQFAARRGDRRLIRFPLEPYTLEATPEGLWIEFFLPKGAYATSLLREVMKKNPEQGLPADDEDQVDGD